MPASELNSRGDYEVLATVLGASLPPGGKWKYSNQLWANFGDNLVRSIQAHDRTEKSALAAVFYRFCQSGQ